MAIPDVPFKEGLIPFKYQNETYQTYYKVYGDLENRTRNPLIVLHGGPGLVHQYLVPFVDLVASASIPVILYDQIGNGRSTHVHDKPPTFWSFDLFIDELLNLVSFLGIESAYDIAGHSWGGILGVELEVRRQPAGLKHLILADSLAAYSLWMQSNMQLMQALPQEVQDNLMTGMKDPAKYYAGLKAFHAVHGCLIKPPPEEFAYSLDQVFGPDGDLTVTSSPILDNWTVIDRLDKVRVPTFVINGRLDIAQDFVVAPFFEKIKQVKWVTFEKSSHTPFWEEREHFMKLVADFLQLAV